MTPFSKERRHRRFPVDVMQISSTAVFSCEIIIQDISIAGVSLLIDRPLEEGTEYTIRIMNEDREISLQGSVVWFREHDACSSQEDAHLRYAAGLKFSDLAQDAVKDLTRFIERHLIGRHTQVKVHGISGCRCNIRFPVDRKESAVLNVAETYRVRKLSLGGMLLAWRGCERP